MNMPREFSIERIGTQSSRNHTSLGRLADIDDQRSYQEDVREEKRQRKQQMRLNAAKAKRQENHTY